MYYKLAVRRALGKPFIEVCQAGQDLPYDVQGRRTIFFNHTDLDSVDAAKAGIKKALASLRDVDKVETPLTVTVDLLALRSSADPDKQAEVQMLDMMRSLDRRVQQLHLQSNQNGFADVVAKRSLVVAVVNRGVLDDEDLASLVTAETSKRHDDWVGSLRRSLANIRHKRGGNDNPRASSSSSKQRYKSGGRTAFLAVDFRDFRKEGNGDSNCHHDRFPCLGASHTKTLCTRHPDDGRASIPRPALREVLVRQRLNALVTGHGPHDPR